MFTKVQHLLYIVKIHIASHRVSPLESRLINPHNSSTNQNK